LNSSIFNGLAVLAFNVIGKKKATIQFDFADFMAFCAAILAAQMQLLV
jgi:hypothetical protein